MPTPPERQPITQEQIRLAELNEAFKPFPYNDRNGTPVRDLPGGGNLTIGIGWNLFGVPMRYSWAVMICKDLLEDAYTALLKLDPWVLYLDPVRQAAIIDLVFNMGVGTWRTFGSTRDAGAAGNIEGMVTGLRNSRWYQQVGLRGPRMVKMIQTGKWPWEP